MKNIQIITVTSGGKKGVCMWEHKKEEQLKIQILINLANFNLKNIDIVKIHPFSVQLSIATFQYLFTS